MRSKLKSIFILKISFSFIFYRSFLDQYKYWLSRKYLTSYKIIRNIIIRLQGASVYTENKCISFNCVRAVASTNLRFARLCDESSSRRRYLYKRNPLLAIHTLTRKSVDCRDCIRIGEGRRRESPDQRTRFYRGKNIKRSSANKIIVGNAIARARRSGSGGYSTWEMYR